jgi:hypothetical protein
MVLSFMDTPPPQMIKMKHSLHQPCRWLTCQKHTLAASSSMQSLNFVEWEHLITAYIISEGHKLLFFSYTYWSHEVCHVLFQSHITHIWHVKLWMQGHTLGYMYNARQISHGSALLWQWSCVGLVVVPWNQFHVAACGVSCLSVYLYAVIIEQASSAVTLEYSYKQWLWAFT